MSRPEELRSKVNGPPVKLPYKPELFVDRKTEVGLVADRVFRLTHGESVRERVVVFRGHRGTGKSWLLQYLADQVNAIPGARGVYIDFTPFWGKPVPEAMDAFLSQLIAGVWKPGSAQGTLYEKATDTPMPVLERWFAYDFKVALQEQVFVFLLDHVYESALDLLAAIEDRFLASVVIQPRVLVVMAGSGLAYRWRTPELRLYTILFPLAPFDQDHTREQLEKQQPAAVSRTQEIYKISGGYAYGNYLLAISSTESDALRLGLDSLLTDASEQERSLLEALCVLRCLDEERISPLWAAYTGDGAILSWSYPAIRKQRDRLLQTKLITWREEVGAWVMDETVRLLLERYLHLTQFTVWRNLHCTAYRLYQDWMRQYSRRRPQWQAEADYHAQCLREQGQDPEQCLPEPV